MQQDLLLLEGCKLWRRRIAKGPCGSSSEEEEVPGVPSTQGQPCQEPEPAAGLEGETSPARDAAKPRAVPASPEPGSPSHSLLEITGRGGRVGGGVWDQGGPHPAAALRASQGELPGGSHGQQRGCYSPKQAASSAGSGDAGSGLRAQGWGISKGKPAGISDAAACVSPVHPCATSHPPRGQPRGKTHSRRSLRPRPAAWGVAERGGSPKSRSELCSSCME